MRLGKTIAVALAGALGAAASLAGGSDAQGGAGAGALAYALPARTTADA